MASTADTTTSASAAAAEGAAAEGAAAAGGLSAMPALGFGTMEYVSGGDPPDAMEAATTGALEAGMRHFDCAELYESTVHVGKAFGATKVPREELWITSKLKGLPCGDYSAVKARVEAHLSDLQLSYVDLLLIHWPGKADLDFGGSPATVQEQSCAADYFLANVKEAWSNMQQLMKEGLARHIGVSNFYQPHLDALNAAFGGNAGVFANEIFIDATHQEREFVPAMIAAGIKVIAYRPLVFLAATEVVASSMGDPTYGTLQQAATDAGAASIPQLILAWLAARGVIPLAKSRSADHIAANLAAAALAGTSVTADSVPVDIEGSEMVAMCGGTDEYAAAFAAAGAAVAEASAAASAGAAGDGDADAGADAATADAGEGATAGDATADAGDGAAASGETNAADAPAPAPAPAVST